MPGMGEGLKLKLMLIYSSSKCSIYRKKSSNKTSIRFYKSANETLYRISRTQWSKYEIPKHTSSDYGKFQNQADYVTTISRLNESSSNSNPSDWKAAYLTRTYPSPSQRLILILETSYFWSISCEVTRISYLWSMTKHCLKRSGIIRSTEIWILVICHGWICSYKSMCEGRKLVACQT